MILTYQIEIKKQNLVNKPYPESLTQRFATTEETYSKWFKVYHLIEKGSFLLFPSYHLLLMLH